MPNQSPLRPHPHNVQRRWVTVLSHALSCALLSALWAVAPAHAQMGAIEDLASFPSGKLAIVESKKVKHEFDVWLADSPRRQAQGLMFVRSLPPARGMLFVHPESRVLSMWMKNTYIPLDMVFIDEHGLVVKIVANTTPHSLNTISSEKPAIAVLEIAGGEAKRLGLHAGQRVSHPALVSH